MKEKIVASPPKDGISAFGIAGEVLEKARSKILTLAKKGDGVVPLSFFVGLIPKVEENPELIEAWAPWLEAKPA